MTEGTEIMSNRNKRVLRTLGGGLSKAVPISDTAAAQKTWGPAT